MLFYSAGEKLSFQREYRLGDRIIVSFDSPCFFGVKLDPKIPETPVYCTQDFRYNIPFGEERSAYSPDSFAGESHWISVREASPEELASRQNLALNPLDQRWESGCYPHCTANAETRGEAVFAARNSIDGVIRNTCHGEWPYQSWVRMKIYKPKSDSILAGRSWRTK